ncbi:cytochrome c peroxidase [Sulfurihydrogenibium sp.]|uniref:cytochrome-c peroxidase n=1 Tax=Sulfurihydrogenibium sp. TaxID=2053621 RepID=UPI00261ED911|nr:cytochrome c peroxidase [Sulfurihydrogenibium sp.]
MKKFIFISFLATGLSYGLEYNEDDLYLQAKGLFAPLPENFSISENPITPEKVYLGKLLFFERRLSINNMVSCSTCHAIEYYYSSPASKQMGALKLQPRNAPTVLNSAGQFVQHWIGNRKDVEDQAFQSLTGPAAFGNSNLNTVEEKLRKIQDYVDLFKKAFPNDPEPIKAENIAKAIGAFERTLLTPSRFDDYLKGNKKALSKEEKIGLQTFINVGCASCHNGTLVGGNSYQKFGILEPYWKYTKSESIDNGRFEITKNETDKYVFKVPSLRNVTQTSPYFHDGSVDSLEEAIWIMGKVQLGKDLSKKEIQYILKFLKTLTGDIPKDAMQPPILPASN